MEEQWQVDRAQLRALRQQHPDWSYRQLAEPLNRSPNWVKKWCHRFKQTDPSDERVIKGHSRLNILLHLLLQRWLSAF